MSGASARAGRSDRAAARTGAPVAIRVEEVTDLDGLRRIGAEWSALWDRCPWATPFQHPDWLIPWCRPFRVTEPWVLLLRREGRLVGIVPLVVYPRGDEQVATLLGAGISDYQDVLAEPEVVTPVIETALAHLAAHHERWDVVELEHLREESPLLRLAIPSGWSDRTDPEDACPVLRLPAEWAGLAELASRRLLENLRYYRRRAERLGPVSVEPIRAHTFYELFDAFVRLHRARWSRRGGPGVLGEDLERFHREVARRFLARGALRLYALRIGPRIAATYYGFVDKARAYYYLGGFDPAFERLSPGTLVLGHAVEQAILEGATEFDFLRGGEAYKYAWGAQDRLTYRRRLRRG